MAEEMYQKFHVVDPHDYLFSVIQKMNSHPFDMIPVVDPSHNGKVIGIVTNQSIMNLLVEKKSIIK